MTEVLQIVREKPNIFRNIVNDPDFGLTTHGSTSIEIMAFRGIKEEAFALRRFSNAHIDRRGKYRKYLSLEEFRYITLYVKYLRYKILTGVELLKEIERIAHLKYGYKRGWATIRTMIKEAAEVVADIELNTVI